MRYFIDTEFIEGFTKPLLGKKRHFIDLISIGIVCEDGRTYFAISNEFSYDDADDWVKINVIDPLYEELKNNYIKENNKMWKFNIKNFNKFYGKSNEKIKYEILKFAQEGISKKDNNIEFYGYYADYDWVVFCSIFGRMIDLPGKFPMYCKDLKQMLDEKSIELSIPIDEIKKYENYPKQINEHSAIADASWNKELYNFINNLNNVNIDTQSK